MKGYSVHRGSKIAFDYKPSSARSRQITHARWFASGLLIPLIGGLVIHTIVERQPDRSPTATAVPPQTTIELPELELPNLTAPAVEPNPIPKPLGDTVEFVVRRNDTMDRLFRRKGILSPVLVSLLPDETYEAAPTTFYATVRPSENWMAAKPEWTDASSQARSMVLDLEEKL